jgi:uncharacterized protein YbjT (DUF2867 family)
MSGQSGFPLPAGRVLVFGASGYIGTHLVARLLEVGCRVRASARNREVLEGRGWRGVELVTADALAPESLGPALAHVEVAYYLVHSMAAGGNFARLDLAAADHFAAAAAAAGVRRIVYLGGIIPPQPASVHLRSRLETGARLRAGPVPVTEVRAGMIVGPGSAAFEVIRDLVNYLPLMITPRWVSTRSTPIALDNLLEYLVRVAALPEAAGKVYDVGGPEVLTYAELMRQYGAIVGKPVRILRVPVLTPGLSARWLWLVTSVPTPIARALIEGLTQDVIADDGAIRRLVPQRLLSFREAVEQVLVAEREHRVVARWVEGAMACRGYRPEYAFYAKRAGASATSTAPAERLWAVVVRIGGRREGYFYGRALWLIRRALDWLVGGPSFRRGRRDPDTLRVGDAVDAWRVIAVAPGRRLTLLMEMKAPGAGVLELAVQPEGAGSRIAVTGYFHPAGVWGLLYWYPLVPFHRYLYRGMVRAITRRAEAEAAHASGVVDQAPPKPPTA